MSKLHQVALGVCLLNAHTVIIANDSQSLPNNAPSIRVFSEQEQKDTRKHWIQEHKKRPPQKGVPEPADDLEYPFNVIGRIIGNLDGKPLECTGQFFGDPQLVLTAAHCVRNPTTGDFATDVMFVRAYKEEEGDVFDVECMLHNPHWYPPQTKDKLNIQDDYAFMRTKEPSGYGYLNKGDPMPPYKAVTAVGYPANYGQGEVMYKVDGEISKIENNEQTMTNNPFGDGASGGAWIFNPQTPSVASEDPENIVVGLFSASDTQKPNESISALLTVPGFNELFKQALQGCNPQP